MNQHVCLLPLGLTILANLKTNTKISTTVSARLHKSNRLQKLRDLNSKNISNHLGQFFKSNKQAKQTRRSQTDSSSCVTFKFCQQLCTLSLLDWKTSPLCALAHSQSAPNRGYFKKKKTPFVFFPSPFTQEELTHIGSQFEGNASRKNSTFAGVKLEILYEASFRLGNQGIYAF